LSQRQEAPRPEPLVLLLLAVLPQAQALRRACWQARVPAPGRREQAC
jgi:hypothetical protein